jgi:proline dehydrogenase
MENSSGPVREFPLAEKARQTYERLRKAGELPDFSDLEQTYRHLSDGELKRMGRILTLIGTPWLSNLLSGLGTRAVKWNLPGASWAVKKTIFKQFVGGTSLITALPAIENLYQHGVTSILDYGAEAKSTEEDFNRFMKEVLSAIDFSAAAPAANAVVVKVTGLAPFSALESLNEEEVDFDDETHAQFQAALRRLDAICAQAQKQDVQVYIDAEESWIQHTVDQLANKMMSRYNKEKVIVFNTFQLYRHDRLTFLQRSHERAQQEGYLLGAKLVRGAYMNKENERAREMGYPTPIQPSLEATNADYNTAVRYCANNYEQIACCVASHNEESNRLMCVLMAELGIPRNHRHICFSQLLGMSDNLTFNLAGGGYNVSKYMVYGPVKEVLPYLVRRAEENTSVTGEAGRELSTVRKELKRRSSSRS